MLHRRGSDHHDVPSSWFSSPGRRSQNVITRTTETTRTTRTAIQALTA